jgi:hypothetical protein
VGGNVPSAEDVLDFVRNKCAPREEKVLVHG